MPGLRMCEAIPPLPNTSLWHDAQLRKNAWYIIAVPEYKSYCFVTKHRVK